MGGMSTQTMTEFLEARIAEDEAVARDAIELYAPDAWDNPLVGGNHWAADIALCENQSPTRVLAECAAKRAIIANWVDPARFGPFSPETEVGIAEGIDTAIRALAAVYADHADYQQEWKL